MFLNPLILIVNICAIAYTPAVLPTSESNKQPPFEPHMIEVFPLPDDTFYWKVKYLKVGAYFILLVELRDDVILTDKSPVIAYIFYGIYWHKHFYLIIHITKTQKQLMIYLNQ